ncbi:4-hydroxy-tetrahydrodipicolinate synthase [Comamonas sp. BIGb0152]|uniref:dihydrodipicolinate synthase family protein n=1 Tax=Comamonas sp. BIGb0152 TaxID=2940601 RepID=UPI00216755CA|nr:dihydrodipicolinate synthase family protein [Comamonas sp. BIGb0152]MCS4292206.1 4-hydroxy-tetrahydrodipicolinate synthase [Comamonas sp. BIGb0152]
MFTGLSAFPLTPMDEAGIDMPAFARLVQRLVAAGVDSIGALGSTGSYAYLSRAERAQVAALAVEQAQGVPVVVGIGALRTRDVLDLASDAQKAGASGLLLAPVSYQKLSEDEVYGLYQAVSRAVSVPIVVYDNPGTTRFEFSDALHGRIAQLPHIASIKIPGVPADAAEAKARVQRLRAVVPAHVSIGVSGDALGAKGLVAGCDAWYSVIGGLWPQTTLAITRAALAGDTEQALALSNRLAPLWSWFQQKGGSLRSVATAAELMGLAHSPCLPLPLHTLQGAGREALAALLKTLDLA